MFKEVNVTNVKASSHSLIINWDLNACMGFGYAETGKIKFEGIDLFVKAKYYSNKETSYGYSIGLSFSGKLLKSGGAYFTMTLPRDSNSGHSGIDFAGFTDKEWKSPPMSSFGNEPSSLKIRICYFEMRSSSETLFPISDEANVNAPTEVAVTNVDETVAKESESSSANDPIEVIYETDYEDSDDFSVLSLGCCSSKVGGVERSGASTELTEVAVKSSNPGSAVGEKVGDKNDEELNERFDKLLGEIYPQPAETSTTFNWLELKNLPPMLKDLNGRFFAKQVDKTNFYEYLILADSLKFNLLEDLIIEIITGSLQPEEFLRSEEWTRLLANTKLYSRINEKMLLKMFETLHAGKQKVPNQKTLQEHRTFDLDVATVEIGDDLEDSSWEDLDYGFNKKAIEKWKYDNQPIDKSIRASGITFNRMELRHASPFLPQVNETNSEEEYWKNMENLSIAIRKPLKF